MFRVLALKRPARRKADGSDPANASSASFAAGVGDHSKEKQPHPATLVKGKSSKPASRTSEHSKSRRNLLTAAALDDDDDLHQKSRASHPTYPPRFEVPDQSVDWDVEFPGYAPVEFTHPGVFQNLFDHDVNPHGWADGPDPDRESIEQRGSHELQARQLQWRYDARGRPLNPRGRTGIVGRGKLGKWGPNHAGDAVVTRHVTKISEEGGPPQVVLQMVAIKRKDTGEWAMPGGMQDPGEVGVTTLVREFKEEAGNVSPEDKSRFDAMVDELFKDTNGRVIYRGYVDDPRNTDNAWMETMAMHFHCGEAMGQMLQLKAGDDAADVTWLEVNPQVPAYRNLYASHKQIVDLVYHTHGAGNALDAANERRSLRASSVSHPSHPHLLGSHHAFGVDSDGSGGVLAGAADGLGWAWAALTQGTHDFTDGGLSAEEMLDINSISAAEFRVAALAVSRLSAAAQAGTLDDTGACTLQIASRLCKGDMSIQMNVFENLVAISPLADLLPLFRRLTSIVQEHASNWTFADDGTPSAAKLPRGSPGSSFRLDARAVACWRVLCFLDKPPALTMRAEVTGLRRQVLTYARPAFRPFAFVMAGPPGSGKSVCLDRVVPEVAAKLGGPPLEHVACVNPDLWISELCDNNNAYRNVANYCNHETFLQAVSQRRHLLFDTTAKSLMNTCGRVVGRLQAAGYQVVIVVVLASVATCWERVEARRLATDRAVPYRVLTACVRDLQRAVPVYIEGPRTGLCTATIVLYNDTNDGETYDDFVSIEEGTPASARAEAAARAAGMLTLDEDAAAGPAPAI